MHFLLFIYIGMYENMTHRTLNMIGQVDRESASFRQEMDSSWPRPLYFCVASLDPASCM